MQVPYNGLKQYGHLEGMGDEFTKRIKKSILDALGVRGKPLIRWETRALNT